MLATATFFSYPSMSETIGIFGGTFDPVHFGHLRLAEEARQHLGLTKVRWIPAGQPRHRAAPQVTGLHRLDMVRLALGDNPAFELDDAEVTNEQPSFTVPTLERLRRELGGQQPLVLLLGADAFAGLPSWHRWEELLSLAHVAVSHRPGFPVEPASLPAELAQIYERSSLSDPSALAERPAGGIISFAMTQLAISATQIRRLLHNGDSPRYLLPDAVIEYIAQHQLYSQP